MPAVVLAVLVLELWLWDVPHSVAHGAELHLAGQEDVFEESWIVDVPRDVPHSELWSVICTGQGEIFCRCPVADMC